MGKSTWERGGYVPVGAEVIPEIMDYREEIAGIGDVEGESIAVGSRREYESKMADSLLDKQSSRIVGELEEKGSLPLNEREGLGISPLKHEEVGVFEKPGFINADRINGSFPEQELPSNVREQSDENQTVDEIDGTGENEQGTIPEPSEATSCHEEERNTESIESCPPIPELHHHLPNEMGEPSIEDGKIMENPVPEVLPGKEIETEDVNENAPVGVVEPNIEHETVIREKDDSTDAEEPEIITYRGRDLVEEGYCGNPPRVELENENVLQTEELKEKGHSVFVEESGGVEGDGLEKAIPSDSQFTENYNIPEKKGEEIGIFSSNEDARKPVTEGGDEADGQIEGTVEPQVSEASVPEEKVDVEVPNEEVAPDIPNVKDNSVDGLPSAEVSALRNKILDEDEIPKTSDNDVDEIYFGDHKEEDVQEDDVIGNDGLSKDRELTTIETVTAETGLPAPGATSNRDSASHPENDFAEGGKNEGSEADSNGITREITDQVAIERDDASPDSNVYTEAMDGYPGNDPISVPEVSRDEFQPDVAEKEAPSGVNASNEFDIAGEEDTSSGLTFSGDHTKKEFEEVSSRASSGEVVQEKAVEVSTELADTVSGRDNDAEAHSVKDDDTSTRKENETLESTDRDVETDDASDPIETEVPIVSDSLGDFVQQETRVIPPEQESLTETFARPLENFAEERNVSEEALSTLEDQPLDVPCASSEVKHKSEESNISEEVHLHAGLPVLTEASTEVSETQTANVPEALTEEKLDVDQRSAELDTEILSVVPVDSNIDSQSASNEASNYEEASGAEAVVTESKIPDEKISKKSFEHLKHDADEKDEDGKPSVMEGESERELDKVPDQEVVLEYTNMSAGNVLNNTFEKSETDMNTEQPHDMADQGDITLIEVPKEQIEEAPVDTTIPSIDLKDSHSDDKLASNEEPKYEESSAAEVVTNRQILEEKILASSFDGESEAQIGQDTDEVEKYEKTAPGKGNSAGEHVEVLAREEVPSVLDETTVDGMQQRDITDQIDIPLTETTVETTEKATVYDSSIDASTDNQRDVSHFGTPTQDQELQTNQKRDEPTNDDATSTLQDDTKINRQTEETPDITIRETTDEVASKIQEDDSFGVAGEVSENPIDGQSASYEDSNCEEASAAEAVVTKSKIPEETSTEEQLRQDTVEIDYARELNEVPNGEDVPEATNASSRNTPNEKFEQIKTEVNGEQPRDMADQGDIALTEVPGEPIEQDGVDTTIPLVDQKDGRGNDQLASNEDPKYEESSVAEASTESEILEEKILMRSFGDSLEAQIEQDADEAEKYEETVVGEGNSAREHDEVPAQEEVPSVLDETIVDGVQQQDITDQTDIELTQATVETTEKTVVYDSATNASIDDQIDASHYGTPTQYQALETNQKRDEPTNDDDASTCQDVPKIDSKTEETTDITLRETTDEVVSKIQEDGGFGVASEVLENPIDGQSSSNADSNYEEASAAEALVFESKIPEEIAIEEQSRQDTVEINSARELDEVPNREEVLEATNASSGNAPNEKFEQLEMEVSGKQPHDLADQGDIARTKVPREPIEQDGVDTTIPLVDQKDGRGNDQLASIGDPKYEESSAAEAITEGEILEENILTRIPDDSLEAQIGQDADETGKYEETVVGEGNSAREHDEVPAQEEVPSVLDETIVDGVQQQDITDQTDSTLTEATVETTGKTAVYDSVIDASTDNQRDLSHFGTPTQDQALKTNQNRDEPTNDDDTSVCQDVPKIDTQTEETTDITLRETTDEVVSKIQEDDSFGLASEVLENPIEESAISRDETIKSEEISGERQDVEEPALGQGDEGSSLVDDNINENKRGTVGSSEFMDAADSIKEIKEDGLQTEDVNEPLNGTGITEDIDPNDIVEKDLIYGTESDEKIDAGEVASETKDISSREVEKYEQHIGESTSLLQVGFSETPESEPSLDQTVVVDQTEEETKEIYDSNDRDGEIADPDIHQPSVNEASDEQTEEEKAAVEVDSNIVSGTETGITDTEPSQISRDVDTKSFEERNSATENTENKESFYEEGKYNIESKDRPKEVTRSEELVEAKETSDEAVFSHSELVESAVAEEDILDQGIGMENSYERDSSLVPPEENEVKDQDVPSGAATDSFSEKKEQDKKAKEPYEEISHPEQKDLVDITEADYDKGTASFIPADTQELITFEGDIQKDEACIKNKMEASENEGGDDQQDAQGILAEEVALEGEIASKDIETDRIVQEDEKGNKEAKNSREANEDGINKDGEVDMGSSTIDEELLANTAPATETADLENKNSYTTADNSHVEVIESEKRDLTLSNEIVEEGDSYTVGADTPFSERSISDNQPGMSSENLDSENAGELNSTAESVEDVAGKEEAPVDLEGHVVEAAGQRELIIATEISDEAALSDTPNEAAITLQTQPRDHSYEQDSVESAPAEGSTIEFNGENEQDRQDKTSDEQSSRVEIDNPEAEVEGIESNEVLQNEAETTEGGSAEEAPQLAHYTEISLDGPSDEMSAFSTSVPDDVQEREIREIVASEDDQTSRTIQEVSEHTNVDGVASADAEAGIVKTTQPTQSTGNLEEESIGETSATITPDENDDSKEESFVVENQITSEQILESTDQQIKPIPSGEAVQEESEVVESASIGKSTLDENPLLHVSKKESESEDIQSCATNDAWSDGKEPTLQTDISQDESDTSIPKYADKERDVTETEEITPLDLGDRGFTSAVQTKEISTEEDASKIKEVVSEDGGESISDAIREVIPVTTDTQPSMSSEYLDGENSGELNPTAVSVEDSASEEEGTDAGIEEASEALVDSKGHEEEATGPSELINATEVSAEAALSDVPDETTATIKTVPADYLYERDFVELTEESKIHVESADGSTIECYGNTEQDIEDKTSNEQTSQVEIDNRDLAADMPPRYVLATAENVEIDRATFDERTTRSSDICEQKSALVEEVEQNRGLELSTLEEAFIQTDREDISLPPEVEVGGSESSEVLQKEAETKEGGSVEEAPQFAHSMEISSDGPSDQIPALSTSVPDNVQEIRTPEILMSEDDRTNRTIRKELDDDSGNKVVHTQEYTSNEERPANGVFVEETIASDQLTLEQESSNSRSGENIGEVIKDVHTDVGGVAAAGIVKPTEPTEITGNLENESIGETGENVMPNETDDSKEESFVEPFPHEEAVIAEIEDVEPVFVGESTLDQSPLADVSREVSTLLHARTEAWSDGNEPMLQTDVCQDESDTSMSKFADKEIDVQESEKITPLELGDFTSAVQTKVVLTEEDTSKIKEVVSKCAGESVNVAIGEVNPVTSDTQPSMSSEYLDRENGGELSSASVSVEDVAGKEEGTDAGIEETSEALIDSKGHEVEATGQRYLINTMEVSDEAALSDASNETAATIQIVPTMAGSTIEFDGENEQEVQDKTFNEKASQVEIDNQDLAAYGPTRDVPATVENVEIDRAELDEQTDGIDRSLPPEAETGGNERNQVLQNESETKEKFSGEEALQSTEISSDGPSDQMSAFRPDAVQEREIREIVASEDEQTNRTIKEELDDESGNKVEQGDNAEKAEQELTSNEERLANGESFEETISSDQLTQSTEQESNGSLGGENVSKVIKCVYTDIGGVSSADAEADITKTTRPTHSTVNLEEESIGETSTAVIPDENLLVPREEAVLAETEDVEQASVGESTFEQIPLADESTLLHARTEVWPDGNEPTLQTDVRQDESDTSKPKYAEKERNVQANGKIAPPELGDRDFSSAVPTKDILTEEDASKTDEVESVDIAADDTKEQPSVTTEDTILKNKEVRDDTGHAAGKPEDMIEIYGDKTSVAASVVDAETTIPHGNEETAEVGESVDDAIVEVVPMTSDSSSPVPKEEEMLATETEHEKENASLEINQRNLKDTADLKYVNINEMAADIPSTDGLASTGSVSYLPQGSIDAITAASVDQESVSLTLPSEETVVDKAWTSRESLDAKHFEVGFKETGTEEDMAEKYGESRTLDFTNAQTDQKTKNEINGGEILSDGDSADKTDYGLASEVVEIADKVDPSLKEKEEKAFDEAQIFQEMASQEQDEYKQGAADEDKAPILSDANDPVEGTVDRAPLEEAEGHTFDSVKCMCTDRKMETPVPNVQGSSEEIFEGDRAPAIEDSKELNQVIASKEDAPTAYHDSGLPRDASLAKEAVVNLPGSTEGGLPPAEAREFRDQSEVNLDSKEFEGEKFSDDTTTVPQTPVADNLQLPEQSAIIKPDENEEDEDDDHEHIEHSKAAPLMEESSKDVVDGKARQKKSHNHLLSGMSSKVKSSISKVKRVITGKSSNHNKEHSPKHGQ